MSDVQPTSPSGARDAVHIDVGGYPPASDVAASLSMALLSTAVRDTAGRAAVVLGRVHAATRGHPALDAGDPLHLELTVARDQLCDAVGTLAASLRRAGLPPQRMLVVVKDAVRAASPLPAEALAVREVMSDAVRCGIAAYYAVA